MSEDFKEGGNVKEPIEIKLSEEEARPIRKILKNKADNTKWVLNNKNVEDREDKLRRRVRAEMKVVNAIEERLDFGEEKEKDRKRMDIDE